MATSVHLVCGLPFSGPVAAVATAVEATEQVPPHCRATNLRNRAEMSCGQSGNARPVTEDLCHLIPGREMAASHVARHCRDRRYQAEAGRIP